MKSVHFEDGRRLIFHRLSRNSPKGLLGRALRWPLRLVPKHSVVIVKSGINKGMRWIAGSSVHSCWLGHYELEKQALVGRLIKPGMTVFDLGANAGFYTLAFSRLVGKTGHVWSFEPFAGNALNLMRHLALNEVTNVTLIQAAVAAHVGLSEFKTVSSDSEWKLSDEPSRPGNYRVPTVALDELVEDGTVPVPNVIKMDVEGAESRVLEGAKGLLRRGKTTLLISVHGHEQLRLCLALLKRADYMAYDLDGQRLAPECNRIDELLATRHDAGKVIPQPT